MDVLPRQFSSLSYCGLWEENRVKFPLKRKIYKTLVISLIYYFTLAEVTQFFLTCESLENFVEIYPSVTYAVFTSKVMNFLLKENDMREILSNFKDNSFKSKSPQETAILNKYFKKSQQIFVYTTGILQLCGISIALTPLIKWKDGIQLPFDLYSPYDVSEPTIFVITYIFQSVLNSFSILINITLDTTVYGFMLLTIGQFELCAYRIENSSLDEKAISSETIKECIEHHVRILNLVKQIESFFMIVVFPFFVCSLLILCTIIFQIAQVQIKSKKYSLMEENGY